MSPQPVITQDFSKGSNLVANPYVVGAQQGQLFLNMLLDEHGSLRVRDGTLVQTTSPEVAPNIGSIIKLFDFVKVNGSIIKLAMTKGVGTNGNSLWNRGTTPWTFIATLPSAYLIPDILTFTDVALIANGYGEPPWKYNGTTLVPVTAVAGQTVPPGAKHHSYHQGYYWLWNTNGATTTLDGPSSLRASDVNNPDSWPNANQLFVDKDDGDVGTGIGHYTVAEIGISPTAVQLLFKNFRTYQVTGVFGASNFSVQSLKTDMGCVAGRTIQFVAGFGIIRLTHRGFARYDGVDDQLISEELRPLLFGGGGYTGIDWANVQSSYAVSVQNPPLYLAMCSVGGTALTRGFCYDLVRKSWTVLAFANEMSTVQLIQNVGQLPVVLAGDWSNGSTGGQVRRLFSGDADDDGLPINWQTFMKPIPGTSPQQPAYFRRLIIKVVGTIAGQKIGATVLFGPMTTIITPTTVTTAVDTLGYGLDDWGISPYGSPTPGFGSGPWGSSHWGAGAGVTTTTTTSQLSIVPRMLQATLTAWAATPGAATFGYGDDPYGLGVYGSAPGGLEMDLTMELGMIGNNARLVLQGQGQLRLRGIEWHVKKKAATRASVYA